jgi:prophage antirepressor-like protein
MNNLSLFKFGGQPLRIDGSWDKPLFCIPDVCEALNLSDPSAVASRLPKVHLIRLKVGSDARGKGSRQGEILFTDEPGLYQIIFRSNKPEATAFQEWVFSEVLPTIRKTGAYHRVKVLPDESDRTQVSRILAAKRRIKAKVNALAGHALLSDEMTVFGRIYNAAALVLWGKPISSVMRELGLTELGYEYPSEWWRYLDSYNQAAWADVLSQVPDWTDDLFSSHRKIRELGESWISAGGTTQPIIMRGKVKTSGPHQSAWLFEGGVA